MKFFTCAALFEYVPAPHRPIDLVLNSKVATMMEEKFQAFIQPPKASLCHLASLNKDFILQFFNLSCCICTANRAIPKRLQWGCGFSGFDFLCYAFLHTANFLHDSKSVLYVSCISQIESNYHLDLLNSVLFSGQLVTYVTNQQKKKKRKV